MQKMLDRQAWLLLAIYASFGFANALSGTFIPVYLWKASGSYLTVALFALAQYSFSGLTFYLCGKWVKEGNKLNCLRVGCLLSGLFYCMVLWLKQSASGMPFVLGAINGIGLGCYWVAYNLIYFEITEPDTRDRFNGSQGLLGAGTGIIAPWLSGLLISWLANERGYTLIFTTSLVIFACCGVISFFIHKRPAQGKYDWLYPFKQWRQYTKESKEWRYVFAGITAQGIREGVFLFLINLIVYIATNNEAKVGTYTFVSSLTSLVSFWLCGRILKPQNRQLSMLVGVISLTAVIIPFFWRVDYTMLLIFGVGTALLFPLYIIPITSKVFDMIGATKQSVEHREELIIFREIALTLGRIIGLIPFFIYITWVNTEKGLVWLLLIVGASPIVGWFFMRPLFRIQHKRYGGESPPKHAIRAKPQSEA